MAEAFAFHMAESIAFHISGQILRKLTTLAVREIGLIWGVKTDLEKLELTVSSIKSVLLDADERKKTSQHVADWLEKLHEVLEDADDLLDDFMTEELRYKVLINGSMWKAVENFFSSSNILALRIKMSHKLKLIQSNLEDIDADRKRFEFVERVLNNPVAYPRIREQTHSFIRESQVIGRDADKRRIIELLLSSFSSSGSSSTTNVENISVLPIVGLGGLGKTTLAKLVYNHKAISSKFEMKLWICVSDDFNLKKLIEKIMKDATGGVDHAHLDLNQLQSHLRTTMESKKFLLVLDDVWTEDLKTWMELKELLQCGSRGSKVIVTTRKRSTAEIMGTFSMYELKGLSDDECMSIFLKCAFKEGEEERYKNLLEIGKEIVMKCKGLPLAVKSLGSLLFTKREEREWVRIRDTGIWEIAQKENDVLPILKLSYDDMPLHLKQCFALCATYPKDVVMNKAELVNRWMAHGLLNSYDECLYLEDTGDQYFHELLLRSFFQEVKLQYITSTICEFKMHDLVHDLALSVAGKSVSHIKFDSTRNISEKTRHLLICEQSLERNEFPHFLLKLNKLRSWRFEFPIRPISYTFLDTLITTFNCLRSLDLNGSEFVELPTSIGMLIHLRYLNLSQNRTIKRLPNNMCNLVNLQTLLLDKCIMLQGLPDEFGNLRSLRCLHLTCQIKCFPEKRLAEGLSSLQELFLFECDHLESLLEAMSYLSALRRLYIIECPNLTSLPAQSMRYLTSLEELGIFTCENLSFLDEDSKMMELPRGLSSLALWNLPKLKELPSGFQSASASIKNIYIYNCNSFEILPDWLKQCRSLSRLRLVGCSKNMQKNCEAKTGKYWHLISHIPQISFSFSIDV